ncbi:MAG: NADH-quinone oxidoreductase subunit L [Thermogemmata sp.]
MIPGWEATPGRLYVVATLLPLAVVLVLATAGMLRAWIRPLRTPGSWTETVYWMLGGDVPLRAGAFLSVAAMAVTAFLSLVGLVQFLSATDSAEPVRWAERIDWVRIGPLSDNLTAGTGVDHATLPALVLQVGYRIDALTAVLFAMVAVVALAIFIFALGYMAEETQTVVEDHEAQHQYHRDQPVQRRGRFGRFYLFLSLFCFAMLHLLIADNLFQIFVSWELVGVCSFWLIGFYQERPSASYAANKAFIINRVGDAGFLIGIAIAWTQLGTLNLEEIFQRLRGGTDSDGRVRYARVVAEAEGTDALPIGAAGEVRRRSYEVGADRQGGTHVLLHPLSGRGSDVPARVRVSEPMSLQDYAVMPYWLWVVMGVGILLGCIGKSAQWPLHTWLPDAMEGPTPVSALIHAATMVAAGVYLVGRCYPLFASEVLLITAYIGAITAFLAASIALVQTDIKRVLAYSTCSQLGLMFLALGLGGWIAGLLHLLTHAFFKALLFLGAGSVIHACHHVQDMRQMGGLRRKMPITALTMLVGVLAISGVPLLSGWYSKERILSQAVGWGLYQPQHVLLWLLPWLTTVLTAYYMFRLWLLTFAGTPRDEQVYEQVQESPGVMTGPLVVLAVLSAGGAWGWPMWEVEASWLGRVLEQAQPAMVQEYVEVTERGHHYHLLTAGLALACTLGGAGLAYLWFGRTTVTAEQFQVHSQVGRFLENKWYFDEIYDAAVLRPVVQAAQVIAQADKRPTEVEVSVPAPAALEEPPPRRFDWGTLDGWLNAVGDLAAAGGEVLRRWQSGRLRWYIGMLALTSVLILGMLAGWNR